jgi:hypothetical protein
VILLKFNSKCNPCNGVYILSHNNNNNLEIDV